jgi:flavin-dependent dehydrogenase
MTFGGHRNFADVVIVGGGPAGAVTGLCLARAGARVAIMDGSCAERFGETVPPEIHPVLAELGLWQAFQDLGAVEAPGIVSRWGSQSASEQDFVANAHGCGWRVDRAAFDGMLLREAERAGARVMVRRAAERPVRAAGVWRVGEVRARYLVDAAGRNGVTAGEREIDDVLLAIALVSQYDRGGPVDARTYIETTPDGWWYSGALPDGTVMAMFFTDPETFRDPGVAIGEQLAHSPLTRGRLAGARLSRSRVVYAPSSCRRAVCGDGWLAVGDSASCYDPLSGRGIFKALRHGAAAAKAIVAGEGAIAEYASQVRDEFASYARQRRIYYAGERRWSGSGFWRRRQSAE